MPIKAAAKKALRQSAKRHKRNTSEMTNVRKLIKDFRENKKRAAKDFIKIQKALDRAVKHHTIKQNTAARHKSRLNKLLKKKPVKKTTK